MTWDSREELSFFLKAAYRFMKRGQVSPAVVALLDATIQVVTAEKEGVDSTRQGV